MRAFMLKGKQQQPGDKIALPVDEAQDLVSRGFVRWVMVLPPKR